MGVKAHILIKRRLYLLPKMKHLTPETHGLVNSIGLPIQDKS